MQQRQLRLGDILDDYCPRERRLTNHVVVALIDGDVKQTRCSTCEVEHEYKQAKLPRLRRKADAAVNVAPVAPVAPVVLPSQAPTANPTLRGENGAPSSAVPVAAQPQADGSPDKPDAEPPDQDDADAGRDDEGPVHRPLIRASLPRLEGAPPPSRPATDFTIRQPAGRQNRFRPRHAGGGQPQGNRSGGHTGGGGGPLRGGMPRHGGHQPVNRLANRHGQGRKRSK